MWNSTVINHVRLMASIRQEDGHYSDVPTVQMKKAPVTLRFSEWTSEDTI